MHNSLEVVKFDSPFLQDVESSLQYLHKAALKHSFYEHLFNEALKEVHFAFFLNQQERVWRSLSENLILLSKLNYPRCITLLFTQNAQFSLTAAGSLSIQLDKFKGKIYKATAACEEYIAFLNTLTEKRLFLPILAAILPRFWLTTHLHKRCLKLNAHNHPYKQFIKHCTSLDAEQQTIRIIQSLDALIQTISEAEKTEIQQLFMDAALHECELLNEAYKQGSSS
ncbi:hypothetical protein IM40_02555 [Candidatus Paracaedimonas acanthamoebae]|nr:hypothetical protein IM40_02555 [Candidatus Paracaedimonas acanthamoebae]